jgi:hypothetical protein
MQLPANAFEREHISTYSKYVGLPLNLERANGEKYIPEENLNAQQVIKDAHRLVRVWAEGVRDKVFPGGSDPNRKISATNQRGNFRDYLPQTFYPDRNHPSVLMYWIYLWCDKESANKNVYFRILLGLNDDLASRALKKKFDEYKNSLGGPNSLTKMLPGNDGASMSIDQLVDWAEKSIKELPATYDQVREALEPEITNCENEIYSTSGYWLEKCDVKGRSDRENGEYKLGNYLWSPQVSEDGKDIYSNMTKAKPGDVVFHLIDRNEISGISIVNGFADETFVCLPDTKWAGQPGYAISLKEYISLDPAIKRDEIFSYKNELLKILDENKGLFYNKKLELNQGKYLTELPTDLVQILSKIYDKSAGKRLPHVHLDELENIKEEGVSNMTNEPNDFMGGLFLTPSEFSEILDSLRNKKNLILQGPPGTGKSFVAKRLAYALLGSKDDSRVESIQFHQSYSYEDFMQGYRPKEEGEGFNLKDGVFYRFCKKASRDLTRNYVFIIDEINRGNLSKIFGEVMLLIENDKRGSEWGVSLTYSNEQSPRFHIPPNLYILGMMNTADRSLAMVDYALRRRFAFKDVEPGIFNPQFSEYLQRMGIEGTVVSKIQSKIGELNRRIETSSDLGAGFRIGHSFFVPSSKIADSEAWYRSVIQNEIAPLLREYWFDKKKSEVDQEIDYLLAD